MSRLVRYAGYDPNEDDFTGIKLRPLTRQESGDLRRTKIDLLRACTIKNETGCSWKEVGIRLAHEEGRISPYCANSVWSAVRYGTYS